MPRVSIVTAALIDTPEKDRWLSEAIASVQRQTLADWEMIIVDDSSPIPVESPGDPRVRVVRATPRQGPALCRNTAVGLARAPAILPLDADDQLAGPEVLGTMLDYWEREPDAIIYGDMQYLQNGQLGKVIKFPVYDFQKVLDPKGTIPVTAMHSRTCWQDAGGWKPQLSDGLEDVEYWIAAGAAGYCGTKIDLIVLLYRRHDDSRTAQMRMGRQEGAVRNMIREMHADLYEGRFPVGCCGGGKSKPLAPAAPVSRFSPPRALSSALSPEAVTTVWVRYNGKRSGQFGVRGPATGTVYKIDGQGHEFEIFTVDSGIFRRSGRGHDFSVGIASPAATALVAAPAVEPAPVRSAFEAPPPQMAQIVALDDVAREEWGGMQSQQQPAPAPSTEQAATPEPAALASAPPPPPLVRSTSHAKPPLPTPEELGLDEDDLDVGAVRREQAQDHPLEALDLGRHQEILEMEGWTITTLASADPAVLVPYPGIGTVTAAAIVEKARRYVEQGG